MGSLSQVEVQKLGRRVREQELVACVACRTSTYSRTTLSIVLAARVVGGRDDQRGRSGGIRGPCRELDGLKTSLVG
jgi:hypothetical protein